MKNKKQTPKMKLSNFNFGIHSVEQLKLRFNMSVEEVLNSEKYFKVGNTNSPYSQVRNKLTNHNHQVVFYNERFNMMLACDPYTGSVCTTMYLNLQ
jgi:hypothetical protein